jgi:hypothetical protein
MPWTTPQPPTTDTVIAVSWARANVTDLLSWLRAMTGNADPPAANMVVASTSPTTTTWSQVTNSLIANGAVDDRTVLSLSGAVIRPSTAAPSIFGSGSFDVAEVNRVIANNAINGDVKLGTNTVTGNAATSAIGTGAIHPNRLIPTADGLVPVASAGTVNYAKISYPSLDTTNTPTDGQVPTWNNPAGRMTWTSAVGVPSGMIAAFATTSLPAGWVRYTSLNGRVPIGDGTTFSQAFVAGNSYGTTWAVDLNGHTHPTPNHGHGITNLDVGGATGGVAESLGTSGGGSGSTTIGAHTHGSSNLTVTGSIGGDGSSTSGTPTASSASVTFITPAFCIVWAQKA